jgi:hypothetical protein
VKKHERPWRVNLPEDLIDAFQEDLEARGMTQREGTIRLIRLYLSLDQDVRGLGMGVLTPERTGQLATLILQDMARGKRRR